MKIDFKTFLSKSLFLLFLLASCVDRINFDEVRITESFPVVIDGFISNDKGPYTISLSKSFDIESKISLKEPYAAKRIIISDDHGQMEELTQIKEGEYQTNKIEGVVGHVYKLRVEFYDGRVYESTPDTLLMNGTVDNVFYAYEEKLNLNGTPMQQYSITANSKGATGNNQYMWELNAIFKAKTHPEYNVLKGCYWFEGKCNYMPPCSGYRNIGNQANPEFVKLFPCECCTCWYNIFNATPILSDNFLTAKDNYQETPVGYVPVNGWTFMDKVRVEVIMKSFSARTFRYFKSIRDQKTAVNSLFQPISGKIPLHFVQLEGPKQDVYGIFYATGISKNSFYITRAQVPNNQLLPTEENYIEWGSGAVSCLDMFSNSSNVKPDFWED